MEQETITCPISRHIKEWRRTVPAINNFLRGFGSSVEIVMRDDVVIPQKAFLEWWVSLPQRQMILFPTGEEKEFAFCHYRKMDNTTHINIVDNWEFPRSFSVQFRNISDWFWVSKILMTAAVLQEIFYIYKPTKFRITKEFLFRERALWTGSSPYFPDTPPYKVPITATADYYLSFYSKEKVNPYLPPAFMEDIVLALDSQHGDKFYFSLFDISGNWEQNIIKVDNFKDLLFLVTIACI